MVEFLLILKYYVLIDIAFVITSFITLHNPAWKAALDVAKENKLKDPGKLYKFSHDIVYAIAAFIAFPFLALAVVFDNKSTRIGYSTSIYKGILNEQS